MVIGGETKFDIGDIVYNILTGDKCIIDDLKIHADGEIYYSVSYGNDGYIWDNERMFSKTKTVF